MNAMQDNLISNSFADNVNKQLIKRNIRLLLVILILFSIYTLLNLADWYLFLQEVKPTRQTANTFYSHTISPWVTLVSAVLGFFVWDFYLKGHRLILLSFENDNPELFNEGYSLLNKATNVNIAGYLLITVSIAIRMFLRYLL
jgi:hypothetical protein